MTPWMDMAHDAGARGDEQRQMAAMIEQQERERYERREVECSEPCDQEAEVQTCVCGHTNHWHGDTGTGVCEYDSECSCSVFRTSGCAVCAQPTTVMTRDGANSCGHPACLAHHYVTAVVA